MLKVLIIAGGLGFGGVERFAANIVKFAPKNEYSFDYLIFDGLGDALVPEIEANGGRVISVPSPSFGHKAYIKTLGKLIDENKYDVVHSQTQFNSGINLWVAKKHKVPIRIAHSHTTAHENKISLAQKAYENFMRKLILFSATDCCSCGVDAGKWQYGNKPFLVINNGIDIKAFKYSQKNRDSIRKQYSIPEDAFLIGHSGTLYKLKNQEFLIRLLPDNAYLMLLGRGEEDYTNYLKELAKKSGKENRVVFTGGVTNANEYLSAFDVFAFPSLREGTPIALIEAQANGLPCIISDTIPSDAIITDLVSSLPLDEERWKEKLTKAKRNEPEKYAKVVDNAGFSIYSAMEPVYNLYRR